MKKNNKNFLKIILKNLGIIELKNLKIFSHKTRDNKSLKVYKDIKSNVIFINDFYVSK